MDRRQAERVRVLGEGDGVAALGRAAADLGGGQLGVPQRDHGERDEPALAVAGAPLVDHPVVVGLHAEERELLVVALEEGLAAEAGQRVREADRRVDVVGVHVGQPLGLLPAPGADLVEGGRRRRRARRSRPRPTASGTGRRGRRRATQSHRSPSSTPFSNEKTPPSKLNFAESRSTRGARSWYLAGSRSVHRVGGSTTWSSTEMMRGVSMRNSFVGPQYRGSSRAGRRPPTLLDPGKQSARLSRPGPPVRWRRSGPRTPSRGSSPGPR